MPPAAPAPIRPLAVPLDRPVRLGVLASGGGTTLDNLLTEIRAGRLSAEVVQVITSRPCGAVAKAAAVGIPVRVIPAREHRGPAEYGRPVFDTLRAAQADLVLLAGFLSLIEIPDDFRHRVLNIHPALIPAFCGPGFYGHHVHEAALARGVKVSGCTVHFADNAYDHGPIVLQRCVPVEPDDTPDTLAARVFTAECTAYPEAIRLWSAARLEIIGQRVRVNSEQSGDCTGRGEAPAPLSPRGRGAGGEGAADEPRAS